MFVGVCKCITIIDFDKVKFKVLLEVVSSERCFVHVILVNAIPATSHKFPEIKTPFGVRWTSKPLSYEIF